jgi:L-serine deaminase
VILVFVNPAVSFLSLDHELVVSITSIDERVDKGTGQVSPSTVNISASTTSTTGVSGTAFQMGFINILECLGLDSSYFFTESLEVFGDVGIVETVGQMRVLFVLGGQL